MQRFTISLDDELALAFDRLITRHGYVNRSEAVRDLIRQHLGQRALGTVQAPWSAAVVAFVYDPHEQTVAARLADLQHTHHDLVVSGHRVPLDHHDCLETLVLRGPADAVQAFAAQVTALRGVRNGQIHAIPLAEHGRPHSHGPLAAGPHRHLKPVT
jgi:CopG family nickel-responsive transcriptional regulator